ncbi:hypothetical protein [Legionella micdadei]|uniref:Coiled-coil protein n=1 Tax=Legionella micdadei TaxID=451 RepID=A0A098GI98_LEGMI|nr:hypothetical protein [Legionella micdadei]ARG98631.1 hypothetical protein B6N58_13730 [Legionella micdadei]ARH01344.1 hypothetical protein B6V88_13585 [Legionella micdadei]KTD28836.1 hypothetical protein Lmic_0756 [Legionella micdadei]NSL17047.1 hypothetical protein [Legionella micdadei]CEG62214.1 conserved membrane protein of unknown function [Legionella micdadei]
MSALLQRLQSLTDDTPITHQQIGTGNFWVFRDNLEEKGVDFFQPLVRIHLLLEFEYSVHCTHLVHSFARKTEKSQKRNLSVKEQEMLTKELVAALAMAELLAHIYHYYLNVPREVLRLQAEQKYYRKLLRMRGYEFNNTAKLDDEPTYSLSQAIRGTTVRYNWHRLFTIRIRRLFITLLPYLQNWQTFSKVINGVDRFLGPTLTYVAWLFFIPRLTVNLVLLFKHLFPNKWTGMAEKEKQLDWLVRLETQLQRRWFQLGNDTAWFTGGVLGCFLFVGALAPTGWYVTVSIFFFDVINASIRAVVEMKRIQKIREEYQVVAAFKRSNGASKEELDEIEEYQKHLEERFSFERKRVILGIINTSALFLGMACALPIFAANPIIPLIGAILVVTVTLANFLANRWIDSHSPSSNIEKISEQGQSLFGNRYVMFQPVIPTEGRPMEPSSRNSSDEGPLGERELEFDTPLV